MARWARCELEQVAVQTATGGRTIGRGLRVDLDEVVGQHRVKGPGGDTVKPITLGDALGEFLKHFPLESSGPVPRTGVPTDDDAADSASRRPARPDKDA